MSKVLATKDCDWEFKVFDNDTGEFRAYFAVFGNIDRADEILENGSIVNIDEFAKDGWIGTNHRMEQLPVAMPISVSQDDYGLFVYGKFHSHPEAQACRAVVKERLANGLSVKGSIGYKVEDSIRDALGSKTVRRLKKVKIYEASFVNLPANVMADVMGVKGAKMLETKSGHAQVNSDGLSFAKSLIKGGKVSTGSWGFSASDGDALLGSDKEKPDWTTYGKCHLATSQDGPSETKAHYKYPFAKKVGGEIKLFYNAITAIRSRSSQQDSSGGVFDAAGELMKLLNPDDADGSDSKKSSVTERIKTMPALSEELRSAAVEQLKQLIDAEFKTGRAISGANHQKLAAVRDQLSELARGVDEFLNQNSPSDDSDDEDDGEDDTKKKKSSKPAVKDDGLDESSEDVDDDGDSDTEDDDDDECLDKEKKGKKPKVAAEKAGKPRNIAGNAIVGQGSPTAADIKSQTDVKARMEASLEKMRGVVLKAQREFAMLPDRRS